MWRHCMRRYSRRILFNFYSMVFGAAALASLSGCQQVAWKPGAGAADLNRDTAACRAQSDDDATVKNCLRQRGWVLRSTSAGAAAETEEADSTDDNVTSTTAPEAAAPASTPISTTNVPARDKLVPASARDSAATSSTSSAPAAAKPKKKPKAIDPLTPKLVQSWWKVGAGAAELSADQAACVETLGAAHQPDMQKRIYTQGMIDCLRARGWSGY